MSDSILLGTKNALGIEAEDTAYDPDIIMHINSMLSVLTQLGIGQVSGFQITGEEELWGDFLGDEIRYNVAKSYVYIRVRLLFDPPQTGYAVENLTAQYKEFEWRLNVIREEDAWVKPGRVPPAPVIGGETP